MSRDDYKHSFESVADAYERSRPSYAPEAVAWIAERLPFERVLDLAAGTGKLTRQLVASGADVVAVEPGDEMRAVLERVVPDVQALAGSAEAIPLPDASVDAITVGQAFHWFHPDDALLEMHRVLRTSGGIALLSNDWGDGDPVLRELDALLEPLRAQAGMSNDWREQFEASPLFTNRDRRKFPHTETLAPGVIVERMGSISIVVAATEEVRERLFADVRRIAGDGPVPFPMVTTVTVADRVG